MQEWTRRLALSRGGAGHELVQVGLVGHLLSLAIALADSVVLVSVLLEEVAHGVGAVVVPLRVGSREWIFVAVEHGGKMGRGLYCGLALAEQ